MEIILSTEQREQIQQRWTRAAWAYQDIGQAWNDIEALLDHIEALEQVLRDIAASPTTLYHDGNTGG